MPTTGRPSRRHLLGTGDGRNDPVSSMMQTSTRKGRRMKDLVTQPESARAFTIPRRPAFAPSGRETPPGHAAPGKPAHDDIARRAYEIYIKNGCHQGQCQKNWRQAEQELQDEGQVACSAQDNGGDASPAAQAGSTPVVNTVPGVLPAPQGGRRPMRAAAPPLATLIQILLAVAWIVAIVGLLRRRKVSTQGYRCGSGRRPPRGTAGAWTAADLWIRPTEAAAEPT